MSIENTNSSNELRVQLESELKTVEEEIRTIEKRISSLKPASDKRFLIAISGSILLALSYGFLCFTQPRYSSLLFTEILGFLSIAVPIIVLSSRIPRALLFTLIATAIILSVIRIADHEYWKWFNLKDLAILPDGTDDRYDSWFNSGEIFRKKSQYLATSFSGYVISLAWLSLLVFTLYTLFQSKKGSSSTSSVKAILTCLLLLLVSGTPAAASFIRYKSEWKPIDEKLLQAALKPYLDLKKGSWILHEDIIYDGFTVTFGNPYILYSDEFGDYIYVKQKLEYYFKAPILEAVPVSGEMNLVTRVDLEPFRKNAAPTTREIEFRSERVSLGLTWKEGQRQFASRELAGYNQSEHRYNPKSMDGSSEYGPVFIIESPNLLLTEDKYLEELLTASEVVSRESIGSIEEAPAAFADFSQLLSGKLNNQYYFQMGITKTGNSLTGGYIYDNKDKILKVAGNINDDGSFTINEFDEKGSMTGVFSGKYDGSVFAGQWSRPDGSNSMSFDASPITGEGNEIGFIKDPDGWVYMREGASVKSKSIAKLDNHTKIQVRRRIGNWLVVYADNGLLGFVFNDRIVKTDY